MANIRQLKEGDDVTVFYPQTHVKAVIDSEGNTLDEILENLEPAGVEEAVKFTPQTLTTAQKTQARTNIGAGTYSKAGTGIPASDMASAVQTSLGKADSAYQKPSGGIPKTDLASAVQGSLDLADTAIQSQPIGSITPPVNPSEYATAEELSQLDQKVGDAWKVESPGRIANGVWWNDFGYTKHIAIPIYGGDKIDLIPSATTYYTVLAGYSTPAPGDTPNFATGYSDRVSFSSATSFVAPSDARWLYVQSYGSSTNLMPSSIKVNGIEIKEEHSTINSIGVLGQKVDNLDNLARDLIFEDNPAAFELVGQKIEKAYFNSTGAQTSNNSFDIYLYDIQSISGSLRIVSYTNWSQPLYAFYSDDELSAATLVQMGDSGDSNTEITRDNLTIPTGAKYLAVNFYRQYGKDAHAYKLIKVIENPTDNSLRGKKWACVGDSLTEVNSRTTKHYFDFVAEELGVIPLNYGVSGSGYARHREDDIAFYQRVSSIDLSADIITIFGSFNDLGTISQDFPIGNITDTGTDSVAGCINTTIDNIQARFPLARLGIISPTPWNDVHPGTAGNSTNYVNIIRDICEYRSIPFLDLWRCSNLRPWDAAFREIAYSKDEGDGVHPDENGHSLIAPKFKQFIKNLM